MNTYYQKNTTRISNNEIIEGTFREKKVTAPTWKRNADTLLSVLAALLTVLCSSTARRIIKVVTFTAVLIAFIGMIGAVEAGTLGLGTGFLIGCVLLGIEYLCLRK